MTLSDRLRAASRDDRLSTGALYAEAANEIDRLTAWCDKYRLSFELQAKPPMQIWKWPLRHQVLLPRGTRILTVQPQGSIRMVWGACDPEAPRVMRGFRIIATGDPLPEGGTYLCTLQEGPLVWHVFDMGDDRHRCPDCTAELTDRTTLDGEPSYCETCDREVVLP